MSIRRRLLIVLAISALAGAALVAGLAIAFVRSAVQERFIDRLRAESTLLGGWIADSPEIDAQEFAHRTGADLRLRVTLIDAEGAVVGDSTQPTPELRRLDNHAGRPEIVDASQHGHGESFRHSATTGVEYFYSAALVPGHGGIRYVRLALPSDDVSRVQSRYAWWILSIIPAGIVLLLLVGYGFVRRLSRPIEEMATAVEEAAAGEYRLEMQHDGADELSRLAAAVGKMQHALIERLAELDAERSMMSSVIEGIQEVLLVVGRNGHVRLANRQLREILELPFDPSGRTLTEVLSHESAVDDIQHALAAGTEIREPIVRFPSGRAFQVRVAPLRRGDPAGADAAVVLFYDITRLERLEAVRREFVANVSHELRTPLTSIKAFVETLSEGGLEDRVTAERFLGIVQKHADRMGDLIEDLTDLSLIETGAIALQRDRISPEQVARSVADSLEPLAVRRNVRIAIEFADGATVYADARRLEQMLTNLVENALKFSPRGSVVRISGGEECDSFRICVEDHGIGIPQESLDKVFHRFFQQNRNESRELGGTGLGLSIVKHLMRLHHGQVRVESELGRGSRFFLIFPSGP